MLKQTQFVTTSETELKWRVNCCMCEVRLFCILAHVLCRSWRSPNTELSCTTTSATAWWRSRPTWRCSSARWSELVSSPTQVRSWKKSNQLYKITCNYDLLMCRLAAQPRQAPVIDCANPGRRKGVVPSAEDQARHSQVRSHLPRLARRSVQR